MVNRNEIVLVDEQSIKEKVYMIRGTQVMLDSDLAEIYGYTTKAFNQQVRNNIEKFPEDFRFQLSNAEMEYLRSNFLTANISPMTRTNPYVFTESGIYMLMSILRGELATRQSIALIRLFKSMKDYLIHNPPTISQKSYITFIEKIEAHDKEIQELKSNIVTKKELSDFIKLFDIGIDNEEILILNGEPFKADVAYQKIYRRAKRSIILMDEYINIKTIQQLVYVRPNIKITVISDNKGRPPLCLSDFNDFMTEYPDIHIDFVTSLNKIHDRYIILDHRTKNMQVYHSGASMKDAGKKIMTISRLADIASYKEAIENLLGNPKLVLT